MVYQIQQTDKLGEYVKFELLYPLPVTTWIFGSCGCAHFVSLSEKVFCYYFFRDIWDCIPICSQNFFPQLHMSMICCEMHELDMVLS